MILLKILKSVYSVYAFLLFIVIMLVMLPLIFFASFWGKVKGGNVIYSICKIWGHLWMFLIGMRHKNIYESPFETNGHYIFVSNHISYMDVPMMMKVMQNHHFRILGKYEMSKIPLFGFIYKQAVVMVDRKSARDRAESIRVLMSVLRKNISVFIFPEGTFNETGRPLKNFFDGAFRVAIETQTPVQPIVFLNSYDRLNYKSIFSLSPGTTKAVFLKSTETSGMSLTDLPYLKSHVYDQMSECLIRYKASWINNNELHKTISAVNG